jgi:hypothetical protein
VCECNLFVISLCRQFYDTVQYSIEAYAGLWWGNLKERDHLGDPDVDGRIILRWIFRK